MAYQGNKPRQGFNPPPPLDISFLNEGLTKDGVIRLPLLTKHAAVCGKAFVRGKDRVSGSQIRKFYGEVLELSDKASPKGGPELRQVERARLAMLPAKAAYARGRRAISPAFEQMISKCAGLVTDQNDLFALRQFLEAIVGYYYGAGGGK